MRKVLGILLILVILGGLSWFLYSKNQATNSVKNNGITKNINQDNPILATPIEKFDINKPEDRKNLIYKIQYSGEDGLIKGDIFNIPKEKLSPNYIPTKEESTRIAIKGVNGYGTRLNNLIDKIKSGKLATYSTMEEYLMFYYFGKIKDGDFQVSKLDSLKLDSYSNLRNITRLYFSNGNNSKNKEIIDHITKMKFFIVELKEGSMEKALYDIVKNKLGFSKEEIDKIAIMPVYNEDNLSLVLRMIILNNEADVVKIKKIYEKGFGTMNGLLDQLTVQSIVNKYESRNISRIDKIHTNFLEWATECQLEHILGFMYFVKLDENIELQTFANKLNSLMIKVSNYSDNQKDEYIKESKLLIEESKKMPLNSFYPISFPYFILANLYTYNKEYNKSIEVLEDMKKSYKVVGSDGNTYDYNNIAFVFAHYGQNYLEVKNYDKALYYYDLEIARQPLNNYMTIYRKAIEELKNTGKTGYTLWNNN